jgi:hypothetical protein
LQQFNQGVNNIVVRWTGRRQNDAWKNRLMTCGSRFNRWRYPGAGLR